MEEKKPRGLSPMMQHYLSVKEQHKDQILFYRLGDFYEMFFDDAKLVSRELELTLTGKECGLEERAPMCGVPYHSCEAYIARLIKKGYKVAICEQMEDPATAKGLVKRDVVRVITPGTVLESNMLEEGSNNYICSIFQDPDSPVGEGAWLGLAFCDISTGQIHLTQITENSRTRLQNELVKFSPSEVIFNPALLDDGELGRFLKEKLCCAADCLEEDRYDPAACQRRVLEQFGAKKLSQLELEDRPLMVGALGGLLSYLAETQRHGLESLRLLDIYEDDQFMALPISARRNLELCQTMRGGEKRGSLLWVLDRTCTAMGKRLLKSWVEKPLLNPTAINRRLNAVQELVEEPMLQEDLRETLGQIFDLERIITRIVFGSVTPRELRSLQYTAGNLPRLRQLLEGSRSQLLQETYRQLDPLEDLCRLLDEAIDPEPPALLRDGGVIRPGYHEELDRLRHLVKDTKGVLAEVEARERERSGIKNLKVGFNNVFGYYLEVSKSYSDQVPEDYVRRQTLTNSERYITQELKELEQTILGGRDRILSLEAELFDQVRAQVAAEIARVQRTAAAVARLDVLTSFAYVAVQNRYCRPQVDLSDTIQITEGRHPVVEAMLTDGLFVSNDTLLDGNQNQIAIITGPNMAGKSTYMRQTALIVLMAQMGSFVPARAASIGVVDGIYTRVGASDDLASGQSTFMVEMNEVAEILQNATSRSLLILDEIGRGTSTFDGMSIARAVVEHIANRRKLGAKTLFATHYHELTCLEAELPGVKNYNIAVKKNGEDIIFLRRILPGGTDDSYGIYVSRLAGIPEEIVTRAGQILRQLEAGAPVSAASRKKKKPQEEQQMVLVAQPEPEALRRLRQLDINKLTPIQALVALGELQALL